MELNERKLKILQMCIRDRAEPNAKQAYVKACSLCPPQGMVVLAGSLYLPSAVGLGPEAAPKPLMRSARPPQPNF